MKRTSRTRRSRKSGIGQAGFTLAELAVVLLVLALLSAGVAAPLGSRIEARERQLSLERLRDIQHALIGFAIVHGRLPCPDTQADPAHPDYGIEDPLPCNDAVEGRLPWRTLAVPATDAWGRARQDASADWAGHWRYRVDPAFTRAPIRADTVPGGTLQVHAHDGSRITVSDSQAVFIVFSAGANRRADGLNARYSASAPRYQAGEATAEFDDLLLWLGRPLLIARLAQAGRL